MSPKTLRPAHGTMVRSVNLFVRLVLWWFFAKVPFGPRQATMVRDAAARGHVVYVIQTRSLFDQLYFNYVFLKHGLPLARWTNGPRTILLRRFSTIFRHVLRRRNKAPQEEQLIQTLERGRAALLFLERPRAGRDENQRYGQRFLTRLAEHEASCDRPVVLVPLLLFWERRSNEARKSIVDGIFGPRQHPGLFRKIWGVLKSVSRTFFLLGDPMVQVGEPVSARAICAGEGSAHAEVRPLSSEACDADRLREYLISYMEQERAIVVGPRFRKGHVIRRELLEDPKMRAAIEKIAADRGVEPGEAHRQAQRNIKRIGADFSMLGIKFLASILAPVWHIIYDGLDVDEDGIEMVRAAARDSRIVVIPSHKSHIDYLIISYAFFANGLLPPHIAAGENLSFPPMGTIFRRAGAFFIRRQFRDDPIYGLCVQRYMGKILQEGHGIEFFIEGSRSRTGKLLSPRFGMLRMLVDAFKEEDFERLKIIPCAVAYERVIEGSSHQAEVTGKAKKQENLGALLRSTKVLTSRYGRPQLTFGEPIDVGEYLARYGAHEESSDDDMQRVTQRLGYRVIHEINNAGTVTPSALTSMVLLNASTRGVGRKRLLVLSGFVLDLLLRGDARLSPSLRTALAAKRAVLTSIPKDNASNPSLLGFLTGAVPDSECGKGDARVYLLLGQAVAELLDEAINIFSKRGLVELTTIRGGRSDDRFFYSIPESARSELAYYKNTIVHAMVPQALLSTAVLATPGERVAVESVTERAQLLSKLFKYEFVYEERAAFEGVLWRTCEEFADRGWLDLPPAREGHISIRSGARVPLEFYRNLSWTFLEAYALAAGELDYAEGRWVSEKDFVERLLVSCRVHYHEGQVRFIETLAKPTFKNALKRYTEWGYLEMKISKKRRRAVKMYRQVEGGPDHVALHTKLLGLVRGVPHDESTSRAA